MLKVRLETFSLNQEYGYAVAVVIISRSTMVKGRINNNSSIQCLLYEMKRRKVNLSVTVSLDSTIMPQWESLGSILINHFSQMLLSIESRGALCKPLISNYVNDTISSAIFKVKVLHSKFK